MRSVAVASIVTMMMSPAASLAAVVRTCPLCPCPSPPIGCICPDPAPAYCPPSFVRSGFDTGGDIEPGDHVVAVMITAQVAAGSGASIFTQGTPPSLLPPTHAPTSFDQDVRTFVSSYSCYPNDATPQGACPVSMTGQAIVTSGFLNVQWSPTEALSSEGSYVLFRLALSQLPNMGPLTLTPTNHVVATVSGQIVFAQSGPLPVNYTVYRQPAGFCACIGDSNWDGKRDGRDVDAFLDCLMGGSLGCTCSDVNFDGAVNTSDVAWFVEELLAGEPCF